MYADYLRFLAERDEPLPCVRDRLIWKAEAQFVRIKHEIETQFSLCTALMGDLDEPENTARFQYAKRYLDEATVAEANKDETQKRHEADRARLETEYFEYLNKRLEYEQKKSKRW